MRSLLVLSVLCAAVAAQEEEDPNYLALKGVVVGARGEALSGVRVEAWDALEPSRFLCEGASGADGRFLLALRRSDLARREHSFGPLRVDVGFKLDRQVSADGNLERPYVVYVSLGEAF